MGIFLSKYYTPYKYFPDLVKFKKTFDLLLLAESEVGKLYKKFESIDVDGSRCIDIAEVLVHLHVEKTFFNKRVFGLLDKDASGELNFEEFVVGLWNYCSVEDEYFEHFAFDLYDTDHSGHIDIEEAQFMVKDIYGEEFEHNAYAKRACHKLAELDMSKIDFETFHAFSQKHKAMLYPAFALQVSLKKYIMGNSFWRKQARNRLRISGGKYKPVVEIIEKKDFHRKRKLHRRDSDLINMFRRSSSLKKKEEEPNQSFTVPGSAYRTRNIEENPSWIPDRRGSKDSGAGSRRGSKNLNHLQDKRRGSKEPQIEKAGARRGSKVADESMLQVHHEIEVHHGSKSANHGESLEDHQGMRRGSKNTGDDHNHNGRRGSKSTGHDHNHNGRRGSKSTGQNHNHDGRRGSKSTGHDHNHDGHGIDNKPDKRRGSKSAAIAPMQTT